MERRVRPWINRKIIEYIGEEEPTLVDFVCSKVATVSILYCFFRLKFILVTGVKKMCMLMVKFSSPGYGPQHATRDLGWRGNGEYHSENKVYTHQE